MENHLKFNVWRAVGACLLVCVIAAVWIANRNNSSLWMARTPEAVYTAYLEQVGELYKLLAEKEGDNVAEEKAVLSEITEETIPLLDQLPEEMPARERAAILRQHYGGILREANQLRQTFE